jgi:hypothetical protein
MPAAHGRAIQAVADQTNRIIISRCAQELGVGLLEENYSSKGFGIKAKSCDWGPFVGFAMGHFQYSKFEVGIDRYQKQIAFFDHAADTGFRNAEVHQQMAQPETLRLTTNRLKFLLAQGKIWDIRPTIQHGARVTAGGPYGRVAFRLEDLGGPSDARWGLIHYPNPPDALKDLARAKQGVVGVDATSQWNRPSLVQGMVNLLPEDRNLMDLAKCCVAGDYDLWAVFPRKGSSMAKHGQERQARIFAGVNPNAGNFIKDRVRALQQDTLNRAPERTFVKKIDGQLQTFKYKEDSELGNVSPLTFDTMNKINKRIRDAGYLGGRMVHHNDDMGNPFRSDVEKALIYFFPNQPAIYDDSGDYYRIIEPWKADYDVRDNPAIWGKRR